MNISPLNSTLLFGARKKSAKTSPSQSPAQPAASPSPSDANDLLKSRSAWQSAKAPRVTLTRPIPTPYDTVPIQDAEIIVFDLETTGLSPKPSYKSGDGPLDDIIEICAMKFKGGKLLGKYVTLVKPNKPIPPEVEAKTNITNEMVQKHGIAPELALQQFADFVGENALFVGHNVKMFDIRFTRAFMTRLNLEPLKDRMNYHSALDTLEISKKLFPNVRWNKKNPNPGEPANLQLSTLAERYGIKNPSAHRAESDVWTNAQVFYEIVNEIQGKGVPMQTVGDALNYQFKPGTKVPDYLIPPGHTP